MDIHNGYICKLESTDKYTISVHGKSGDLHYYINRNLKHYKLNSGGKEIDISTLRAIAEFSHEPMSGEINVNKKIIVINEHLTVTRVYSGQINGNTIFEYQVSHVRGPLSPKASCFRLPFKLDKKNLVTFLSTFLEKDLIAKQTLEKSPTTFVVTSYYN